LFQRITWLLRKNTQDWGTQKKESNRGEEKRGGYFNERRGRGNNQFDSEKGVSKVSSFLERGGEECPVGPGNRETRNPIIKAPFLWGKGGRREESSAGRAKVINLTTSTVFRKKKRNCWENNKKTKFRGGLCRLQSLGGKGKSGNRKGNSRFRYVKTKRTSPDPGPLRVGVTKGGKIPGERYRRIESTKERVEAVASERAKFSCATKRRFRRGKDQIHRRADDCTHVTSEFPRALGEGKQGGEIYCGRVLHKRGKSRVHGGGNRF